MLWLLRCNAVASFDPFATGNYTENNNWLYHSGELDHRRHYPYDVFFIQPTLYILSIRETTGLVQIPFYIQGLSFPLNLFAVIGRSGLRVRALFPLINEQTKLNANDNVIAFPSRARLAA